MAQSAVPVTTSPRTITVRVRTVAIVAAIVLVVGVVWWTASWASSLQPLGDGNSSTGAYGLPVVKKMPSAFGLGPTAYGWRAGGRYVVELGFHNTASVPITITGTDGTYADQVGAISGPTLQNATANFRVVPGTYHAVRIPADGTRIVAFVFHANPHAACSPDVYTDSSVTVHFTALGVFHDTQTVQLGDMTAYMKGRRC